MSQPLWSPSPERVASANVTRFRDEVNLRQNLSLPDFAALYRWSVERPEQFWPEVWRFAGVQASRPCDSVLIDAHKMPGARWFVGAELNFAHNLLAPADDPQYADSPAVVAWDERGRHGELTFAELHRRAAQVAALFHQLGVLPGDRVAGFLPNIPEAIVAMLAAASLGAVWSSCSPDFGPDGVVDRFGQIEPVLLITADAYLYNARRHDCLPRIAEILPRLPTVRHVLVVPHLDEPSAVPLDQLSSTLPASAPSPAVHLWPSPESTEQPPPLAFLPLPFDHPLYILYSSGTTGRPKCIVHGAGGTLLQHLKEHQLHVDLHPGDRMLYFTTCGWMMWNWLVSALASRAVVVLYDGSPTATHGSILFDLAQRERLTVFGASAKYFASIDKLGLSPRETHDLSSLRTILSTGSPLAPETFDFLYGRVHPDVCVSSISGGTDIVSCFALGNPTGPVFRGELQTRGLGMKVEVFDDQGQSLVGQPGELVCTAPFPSAPVGFWNDPDGAAYHDAYFDVFPNVWRHGDWAEITPHDGLIVHGRSDATLNPGGVRIGTAELYRIVESFDEVLECLAVGQPWHGDVRILLFVRLSPGHSLTPDLVARLRSEIRRRATPRHIPAVILDVPDLPRTKSGKITELAVRDLLLGRPLKNLSALANPQALDHFRNRPELNP